MTKRRDLNVGTYRVPLIDLFEYQKRPGNEVM